MTLGEITKLDCNYGETPIETALCIFSNKSGVEVNGCLIFNPLIGKFEIIQLIGERRFCPSDFSAFQYVYNKRGGFFWMKVPHDLVTLSDSGDEVDPIKCLI